MDHAEDIRSTPLADIIAELVDRLRRLAYDEGYADGSVGAAMRRATSPRTSASDASDSSGD